MRTMTTSVTILYHVILAHV